MTVHDFLDSVATGATAAGVRMIDAHRRVP